MQIKKSISLAPPSTDLKELLDQLGCKLFALDRPLVRYIAWSLEFNLIDVIERNGSLSITQIPEYTSLSLGGADALLGVLCALGLVTHNGDGEYTLSKMGREYLTRESPYFIGNDLYPPQERVPQPYIQGGSTFKTWLRFNLLHLLPGVSYGDMSRLRNQHTRNLSACVVAVDSGEFDDSKYVLDIAGGSGAFSIPLAMKYPDKEVILVDLPKALNNIQKFISEAGMSDRIKLRGINVLEQPWNLPVCDTVFISNLLHGFGDEVCLSICRECFRHLETGGRIWIHEMLWNNNRDGPLITALWNASMRAVGGGAKQRTAQEMEDLLSKAGFVNPKRISTTTAMYMVGAIKP